MRNSVQNTVMESKFISMLSKTQEFKCLKKTITKSLNQMRAHHFMHEKILGGMYTLFIERFHPLGESYPGRTLCITTNNDELLRDFILNKILAKLSEDKFYEYNVEKSIFRIGAQKYSLKLKKLPVFVKINNNEEDPIS